MPKHVLVTGGAGFVGSHIVDELVARGHTVRVLDTLDPQVHGAGAPEPGFRPEYLNPDAELVDGSCGDRAVIDRALEGIDVVFHEAAVVGVGQSMYEIDRYVSGNTQSTAVLLQAIVDRLNRAPLERLIVASSMSIYGEGQYRLPDGSVYAPPMRPDAQLTEKQWDMLSPNGAVAEPEPTSEEKPLQATSVYALSKRDQEDYCMLIGGVYGIPTVALRYFNIYGPRQALSNPYTGVAAIFGSCILNGDAPIIYEDGCQSRDFVHVSDIVQANMLASRPNPRRSPVRCSTSVPDGRRTSSSCSSCSRKLSTCRGSSRPFRANSGPATSAIATPTSHGFPRPWATHRRSSSTPGSPSWPSGCAPNRLRTSRAAPPPSWSARGSCDDAGRA